MTFRYNRFRILLSSALFLVALIALFAWRDGDLSAANAIRHLWILLFLPFVAYFVHGGYLLDKYRLDGTGLTVKRPLRTTIRIEFADIETLRLVKPTNYPGHDRGTLEIRYRPRNKVNVVLDRLRGAELFVRAVREGFRLAGGEGNEERTSADPKGN